MREIIEKFMNGYKVAKGETFANNPFGAFVRDKIPQALYNLEIFDKNLYLIRGSVGQGNWALVPWVCIFNKQITTSATKGVYIAYLLSTDCNRLYLVFDQGCTDIRKNHSLKDTIQTLRNEAKNICNFVDNRGFRTDENIVLGDRLTELALLYQKGAVFYKEYNINNIPSDDELVNDLRLMSEIYNDYIQTKNNSNRNDVQNQIQEEPGMMGMTVKEKIEQIGAYIRSRGFSYENGMIENFWLSLKSKPFVILAGTSGTGKTRLVRLFAEAIGAEYRLVPVRPDWSDSSDLLGHYNIEGKFVEGRVLKIILEAQNDPEKPYLLCLDEMNLARVEYYLSDFLSVIETRDLRDGRIVSDRLLPFDDYGDIRFPENLYLVGTVNMDETTFPFSKKVLDRANTIEFSTVDLMPPDADPAAETEPVEVSNDFLKSDYLLLSQCLNEENRDFVESVCTDLEQINRVLKTNNAHVGYRVRDEVVFYMLNNQKAGLLSRDEAFDNAVMQKILPRIQGSSASVKDMLCELFKIFAGDFEGYRTQNNDTAAGMFDKLGRGGVRYPRSAEKTAFMVRRFDEDGFTSYWL